MEKKDYRFRSKAMGKAFTAGEWSEYLREHDDVNEIVASHGPFGFNVHDVCMTPNVRTIADRPNVEVRIATAQSPNGRWDYGLRVDLYKSGSFGAPSFIEDPEGGYHTEDAAIYAALMSVKEMALRKMRDIEIESDNTYEDDELRLPKASVRLSAMNGLLKKLKKELAAHNPAQVSLFE